MGYDIIVVEVDQDGNDIHHEEVGVTYNYNEIYTKILGQSIGDYLNRKKCSETAGTLSNLVSQLGTDADPDHWAVTEGNAGKAASDLLDAGNKHPNAHWEVY